MSSLIRSAIRKAPAYSAMVCVRASKIQQPSLPPSSTRPNLFSGD